MLKKILSSLFSPHNWDRSGDHRTCTVCNKKEKFDNDGGFEGGSWVMVAQGDSAKHH